MDLNRAQEDWVLGRFPYQQLPELAAQMMMQGHDGPAILDLASFHMPYGPGIPSDLVAEAFLEAGLPPLSRAEASLRLAERLVEACLREEIDIDTLADKLWALNREVDQPWDSPFGRCLGHALELSERHENDYSTASLREMRRHLIQEAGRFLAARRSPPASSP